MTTSDLALPTSGWNRFLPVFRLALVMIFAGAAAMYVVDSVHWPLMVDSPVMHYVNFLIGHGIKPYSGITDMNMPGAYLADAFEMRAFGPGDLALRVYVFFLGVLLTAAMIVIARPRDWLAGLYAGGFFVLLQGAEGPKLAAEREQVMTTLIFLAYASLFVAVRRQRPALALVFGLLAGFSATIKPTVLLLPIAAILLMTFTLRKRNIDCAPFIWWSLGGLLLGICPGLLFLLHYHAFGAFVFILHRILPAYASMIHPTRLQMLKTIMPVNVALLLPLAAVAGIGNALRRGGWDWERWALALGAATGAVSYFAQNKGFLHHRYLFLCFLLLLIGLEFATALRGDGVARWAGVAGLAISTFLIVPRYLTFIGRVPGNSDYTLQLERDLRQLGGDRLQHQVLCLDLVAGCLNSLYHLGLVENTGYTGDLLLFSPVDGPAVQYYRTEFMRLQAADPANVIVVSNEWLERPNTFTKLDTWPAFQSYLERNYTAVAAREFPMEGRNAPAAPGEVASAPAYRIYVRHGSWLLPSWRTRLGGG